MHNVLCDVLWQQNKKNYIKKILNIEKKIQTKKFKKKKIQKKNAPKKFKKKIQKKKFTNKISQKKFQHISPHKICIVSHSSYHTRRITLVVSHSHATSGGI